MRELFPKYPRLFTEADLVCLHPINSIYEVSKKQPSEKPCVKCQDFLSFFQRQYASLLLRQQKDQQSTLLSP